MAGLKETRLWKRKHSPAIVLGVCLLAKRAELCWTYSFGLGQSLVVEDVGHAASGLDALVPQRCIAVRNDLLPVYAQERTGNTI